EYIRQQERFIERFRAKATKAAAAQSAIKRLEKLERIEDIALERPDIRINFTVDKTPGKVLAELKDISKHFGPIQILNHASAEIERGDKIALIGANGKGKSTLLRIIAGTEPIEGERRWGHNVEAAFYAQHQLEALNLSNTVLDEMKEAGAQKTELELRTLLGCFLFSGDDVEKKIKVLSGGEKARVALAKTIISKANFLLLDEPTNHLDIHSTELLIDALKRYEGSYILVSHDRYFISKTANKIWEIVDGAIKEFKGPYEEWVAWKERNRKVNESIEEPVQKITAPDQKKEQELPTAVTNQNLIKSADRKELQRQQRLFQKIEEEIAQLTKEKAALEEQLSLPDTYSNKEKFTTTEKKYKELIVKLNEADKQYEKVFEKILQLESEQKS
ncbi:MAG: ABC-F family ATP-binding cassette domain-containing protein, partial [Flavisolibacter sp.]|nr:ABC-F family ATP-binding cassette domain-containing protein [Flavisolibacter sp.]